MHKCGRAAMGCSSSSDQLQKGSHQEDSEEGCLKHRTQQKVRDGQKHRDDNAGELEQLLKGMLWDLISSGDTKCPGCTAWLVPGNRVRVQNTEKVMGYDGRALSRGAGQIHTTKWCCLRLGKCQVPAGRRCDTADCGNRKERWESRVEHFMKSSNMLLRYQLQKSLNQFTEKRM